MPGLVTAWKDADKSAGAAVGWFGVSEGLILGKGMKLVAATLVEEDVVEAGSWLDTATDTVLVVDVAQELIEVEDTEELASALFRAWNAAARCLSFRILLWLLCLCLGGGGGT